MHTDLSDFPLASSCGMTCMCSKYHECVSPVQKIVTSGVECGKIEFLKKPSRIYIAF
jgi:hypothetical protein